MRSLDADADGVVSPGEVKERVAEAIARDRLGDQKSDGTITPRHVSVFAEAAQAASEPSPVTLGEVLAMAKSERTEPIAVPPPNARTTQGLPSWFDRATAELVGHSIANPGGPDESMCLSVADRKNNYLYVTLPTGGGGGVPTIDLRRGDLPMDPPTETETPVSPALAEELAPLLLKAAHEAGHDVGRTEKVQSTVRGLSISGPGWSSSVEEPGQKRAPRGKMVSVDPESDVQAKLQSIGRAIAALNRYSAAGPEALNDSAPNPATVPQVEAPTPDERQRTERAAHEMILDLVRHKNHRGFSPEEQEMLARIKAVDVGSQGHNGYPHVIVHFKADDAQFGQLDLAKLLKERLAKMGLTTNVGAYVLWGEGKPTFNNGHLTVP